MFFNYYYYYYYSFLNVFYRFCLNEMRFSFTKWPKCKIQIYIVVNMKNNRANNESESGVWKVFTVVH